MKEMPLTMVVARPNLRGGSKDGGKRNMKRPSSRPTVAARCAVVAGGSPTPAHERLARAQFLLGIGKHREAGLAARRILAEDPKHIAALELYAKALWAGGRIEQLLGVLHDLIGLNPYEPGYYSLLGAALQATGQFGKALRALNRSLELSGEKADAAVRQMAEDIRRWQEVLIQDLLAEDAAFRREYERDAEGACEARGFHLRVSENYGVAMAPLTRTHYPLYSRPS